MTINRTAATQPPRLFIGSSSEGKQIAKDLERALDSTVEVLRWDRDVFNASTYVLPSLLEIAAEVDFAVLVATPDDMVEKRGKSSAVARDNIILEFGLFAGALGLERTFLLAAGTIDLPSDIFGLTRLPFREDVTGLRAVSGAAYDLEQLVAKKGRHRSPAAPTRTDQHRGTDRTAATDSGLLAHEIGVLECDAAAQGWKLKTNSASTLRLTSPRGRSFALSKSTPRNTRIELRRFVRELRGHGLRVNNGLRRPVGETPW